MTGTHARSATSRGPLAILLPSFLLLVAFAFPARPVHATSSSGPEAARIATVQGAVLVRGEAQRDWGYAEPNLVLEEGDEVLVGSGNEATLEFPHSVFVTLSAGSRAEIHQIRPGLHLRLLYGTFHVVLLEDLHAYERARIEWPRGNIYVEERGCYRADVFRDGLARVASLRGEALVHASGGRSIVDAGEVVYVEPGGLPTSEGSYRAGDYDAFDRYALDRVWGSPSAALPPFLSGYGAVGLRDLSRYGQWIYVPAWGKYAWRPRGVARTWRPYRDGRYVFTGFGWTWIPREPWGYAPCHYGNWGYLPKYGWLWQPGRRFAPAWVRWSQAGNTVGWAVIGPNGQIVVPPAAIYGSPYVFMAAKDFQAGKPVKQIEAKGKPGEMKLPGDATPILEPDPEAKIKAPKLKPGHPSPANQAAEQAEKIALKQGEKSQREAEREARALAGGGHKGAKEATEGVEAPTVDAPASNAPAVAPAPAVIGAPATGGALPSAPVQGGTVGAPPAPEVVPAGESTSAPAAATIESPEEDQTPEPMGPPAPASTPTPGPSPPAAASGIPVTSSAAKAKGKEKQALPNQGGPATAAPDTP